MKTNRVVIPLVVALCSTLALAPLGYAQARKAASPSAVAQPVAGAKVGKEANVTIKKIGDLGMAARVKTPDYSVDAAESKKGMPKEWARVWVQYVTTEDWTDELKIKYYVLLKHPKDTKAPYTIFTGESSYCDIPKGKEHISSMFIHPSTFLRYGEVERIAVEICSPSDDVLAVASDPDDPKKWWRTTTSVRSIRDGLLSRSQTPFAFVAYDNYERLKAK